MNLEELLEVYGYSLMTQMVESTKKVDDDLKIKSEIRDDNYKIIIEYESEVLSSGDYNKHFEILYRKLVGYIREERLKKLLD